MEQIFASVQATLTNRRPVSTMAEAT